MELDFDKEIDALMRREAAGRTITISERAGLHLDADEVAAFAEGAVPERARATFMHHFAECDSCRGTLSHAIALQAAEAPAASHGVAAPAVVSAVPWYRKLFLFPNLAYVMGGLVVLFAGFMGLSLLTYRSAQSDISMARPGEDRPSAATSELEAEDAAEPLVAANSNVDLASSSNGLASSANTAANVPYGSASPARVANTVANTSPAQPVQAAPLAEDRPKDMQPRATPAPPAKTDNFAVDGVERRRIEKLPSVPSADREIDKKEESKLAQEKQRTAALRAGPMLKAKEPARDDRDEQSTADAAKRSVAARKVEALPLPAANAATGGGRKTVGGRTFEYRNGAWYETGYKGQGTVNVRRNTEDYRKLDTGLRVIAEKFIGTVVVTIWNGKAYRIQ